MPTIMFNISDANPWLIALCIVLVVRELIRKGIALYKAWQKNDKVRFILIFILNTCGILPIIYLLCNRKRNK